jgi:hypothetical protein
MSYEQGGAFNSFMRGMDATQRWRANRQDEEIRDILIRSGKDAEGAHRLEMEERGLTPSSWGLKNPWMDKFFSFAKGWGAGKMSRPPAGRVALAMEDPTFDGMTPEQIYDGPAPSLPEEEIYADGGRPRRSALGFADGRTYDEEVLERAAQEREGTKGSRRVDNATENVKKPVRGATANSLGNVDTQGKGRVGGPSSTHNARRAIDRGASSKAGKLGTLGALAATAATVASTPTEDYQERFAPGDDVDPRLQSQFLLRALGAASDLGNVLTFGQAGRFFRDKQNASAPAPAAPAAAPTPTPAPTPAPAAKPSAGTRVARSATGATASAAPAPQDMMDITKINVSDVGPESIPDFRTRDWSDFREKALDGLVARGMPLAQAAEQVDSQVVRMQQQGFNHFAMQAASLMRAGNEKGAMAAIKAAYQMFPSGDDVKLGTYNGQIYGITIDEETGKPTGQPIAITPESILSLVDQANKPGAWNEYAKDQRDFQLTLKKYLEMEKPLSEAQGSAMLTNASANMLGSQARMLDAQTGATLGAAGGGGGSGGAGFRNSEKVFRDRLMMMGMTNEAEADRLASIMSQMKLQYPSAPDNLIIEHVMKRVLGNDAQE